GDRLLPGLQADDLFEGQQVDAAQVEIGVLRGEPVQVGAADRDEGAGVRVGGGEALGRPGGEVFGEAHQSMLLRRTEASSPSTVARSGSAGRGLRPAASSRSAEREARQRSISAQATSPRRTARRRSRRSPTSTRSSPDRKSTRLNSSHVKISYAVL